ncbi:MAG TPA: tetratricopeptide repeat protein [Pyrinomonadaceae bacterium]|nr:tetratricopeptide repeat protein [Pyrinomonadaceae bacterium]
MKSALTLLVLMLALTALTTGAQTTAKDFYEKGKAESQRGNFKAAGDNYRKALDIDQKVLPPGLSAVMAKIRDQDVKGALEALNAAIKAEPNDAYFYFVRAIVSTVPGAPASAAATTLPDLAKVLELAPNNGGAYYIRGLILVDKRDYDGAIADLTKAIDLHINLNAQELAGAFFNRGKARFGKNDNDGAIADITRAIEIDPKNADFYLVRAGARVKKNDMEGVIADYSRVIVLQPANVQAIILRGQMRMGTKDWDGAIDDLTAAIKLDPRNAQIPYYNRAQSRFSKLDSRGAIADCTRSIEVDPKYAPPYDLRGLIRGMTGDTPGAIEDITKAIQLAPNVASYYKDRAIQYREQNKPDLAAADEKRAAELEKK